MKAYLLNSLKIGPKTHRASTEENPVVIDIEDREFKRLEAMSAVRAPTENELKIAASTIDLEVNETTEVPEGAEELTAARARYLELFGEEANSRSKLDTIKGKIAEKEAAVAAAGSTSNDTDLGV